LNSCSAWATFKTAVATRATARQEQRTIRE
jgi:hypothetical protein